MPTVEPWMDKESEGSVQGAGHSAERIRRGRPEYKDEGIVLRTYKLGESDKILRILTREHGKVSAVAKGVRKTSSRLGARVEPLTRARLFLHRGRTLDTVKQVEILTSFQEVREDLGLFVKASSMAELADSIAADYEANPRLFDLLLLGLQLLKEYPGRAEFALAFYEFKVMGSEGFELMVGGCANCGGDLGEDISFSLRLGGFICGECTSGRFVDTGKLIRVSPGCAGLLSWMAAHRLGEWPGEPLEDATIESGLLMGKVLEHWMEREFRSHRVARAMPGAAGEIVTGG
jgi:DNA repair protein RecO (recombination protein O)